MFYEYLEDIMKTLAFVIAALAMGVGVASAMPVTGQPSAVTNIENWTANQWNAAKANLAKDQMKWAECRQQIPRSYGASQRWCG